MAVNIALRFPSDGRLEPARVESGNTKSEKLERDGCIEPVCAFTDFVVDS